MDFVEKLIYPTRMTRRAQSYVVVIGLRHLAIGTLATFFPYIFDNPSFVILKTWLPIWMWGIIFLGVGFMAPVVAWMSREFPARFFILISLTVSSFWGASFLGEWILRGTRPGVAAPVWAVIWLSLALIDLIICAMPLRSPFEDYLKEEGAWQVHPPSHG